MNTYYQDYQKLSSSQSLLTRSKVYLSQGKLIESLESAKLGYSKSNLGWSKLETCPFLIQLSKIKYINSSYSEAINYANISTDIALKYMSKNHPYYLTSQKIIADCKMKQGELQKANKIFKELQLIYLEKFKFYENNLNENLRLKLYYELLNVNMALFEIKNKEVKGDFTASFNNWNFIKGREINIRNSITSFINNSNDTVLLIN